MANSKERELRQMNRTELIEIIYALQQNEKNIRAENEELHNLLDDRTLRIQKAGSIAEAAMSLNHVFEDAQKAAEQYLESIKERELAVRTGQVDLTREAQEQAREIVANAQRQAEEILASANAQAQVSLKEAEEAEQRIRKMAAAFKKQRRNFLDKANAFMEENPEFASQMKYDRTLDGQQGGENQ